MASPPSPTEPEADQGKSVLALRGRNWLALASLLLSVVPLVVWMLAALFGSLLFPPTPSDNNYAAAGAYDARYFNTVVLITLLGLIGSVSAIVIGRVAASRAKRYQWQRAWPDLARAGWVMGIVGIVALFIVAPCAVISLFAGNYHGG